jgi:predicted phosphodiesterase
MAKGKMHGEARMRFLLISDTHGKLGVVNELAAIVRADAVIHAWDVESRLRDGIGT